MPVRYRQDATRRRVDRTAETEKRYRGRYPSLCRCAGMDPNNLEGVIDWFVGNHGAWSPATIRQYRACLILAIEEAERTPEALDELLGRVKQGPCPRKFGPRRTSALKRRSIPRRLFRRLIRRLMDGRHPDDMLAARLLSHNVILFMRPGEWLWATIRGNVLTIKNGKATNGRALGTHRQLDLRDYGESGVGDLSDLLATLKLRAKDAESFRSLWAKLASRIARACKRIRIKRLAPYSTRHVGMATAKTWMSPAEVAASAGHKTTATATAHYARRQTGWRNKRLRVAYPMPEAVAQVIRPLKANRAENMEYWEKKRTQAEDEPPAIRP
jgi:hypothetical protein